MTNMLVFALFFASAIASTLYAPEDENQCAVGLLGTTIENSNRTGNNACPLGSTGDECSYKCDDGYIQIGRHVCQNYTTQGDTFINHRYFGGRCVRQCPVMTCETGKYPIRYLTTDSDGDCIKTAMCATSNDAFKHIARSSYEVFDLGRNANTGIYIDHVNLLASDLKNQGWNQGHTDATGLGLTAECIAHELGWIDDATFKSRVKLTLSSLAGYHENFSMPRSKNGWIPRFPNSNTGAYNGSTFEMMPSGLCTAGVLFAKTYTSKKFPKSDADASLIQKYAEEFYQSIQFDTILWNRQGEFDPTGDGVPMTSTSKDDTTCGAYRFPESDGYFAYNEEHYTVWLAHEYSKQRNNGTASTPIENMWQAWNNRKSHPNITYQGQPLLSQWASYIVQLPYYMVYPFNSDEDFKDLFSSHYEADKDYYSSALFYGGERGRYGLGAGTTQSWCSGSGYSSDVINPHPNHQACRTYSPYAIAGYMPVDPTTIKSHLLDLLADGETVTTFKNNNTDYHIMFRKSMLNPSDWTGANYVTLVDFSSELLGLSTLWLPEDFFQTYTNHFEQQKVVE